MSNKKNYILYAGLLFQTVIQVYFIFRQEKLLTFIPLWFVSAIVGIILLLMMMANFFSLTKKMKIWLVIADVFLILFPILIIGAILLYVIFSI